MLSQGLAARPLCHDACGLQQATARRFLLLHRSPSKTATKADRTSRLSALLCPAAYKRWQARSTPRHRSLVCRSALDSQSTKPKNPFQSPREFDGLQKVLAETPATALYAVAAVFVGAAAYLGGLVGNQVPASMRTAGRAGGAAIAGVAAAAAVTKLQEKRGRAAALQLYNDLGAKADPAELTDKEVAALGERFGVDVTKSLVPELQQIYGLYLENIIPPGTAPLQGDEVDKIKHFKGVLGLSDEDAAPEHVEAGKRIMRSRFEVGNRGEKLEQTRTLQKLIFVTRMVFGEQKSAFLTPWARLFNMTPAQIQVAISENARGLFKSYLDRQGAGVLKAEPKFLHDLKAYQQRVMLSDEVMEVVVKEAARAQLEAYLDAGVECIKRRGRVRDLTDAITAVKGLLEYNRNLEALREDEGVPLGVGRTTIYGGAYDGDGKGRDLRDLFRTYVEEELTREGEFTADMEDDVEELQLALGLGKKEAGRIVEEIVSKAYRKSLREEVQSGRLEGAASKAAVLEELCNRYNFDPEAAAALHRQLFRQKVDSLLEKERLTDDDVAEIDRLRKMLCIPKSVYLEVQRETSGRVFQKVVEDAMRAGVDNFDPSDRENVKKALADLRLDPSIAKELLAAAARKGFLGYITRSRKISRKVDQMKEIRKMVVFSNSVVAPLLEDVTGKSATEDAMKEIAQLMAKAKEEAAKEKEEEEASGETTEDEEAVVAADKKGPEGTIDLEPYEDNDDSAPSSSSGKAEGKAEAEEGKAEAGSSEVDSAPATLKKAVEGREVAESAGPSGSGKPAEKSQKEITLKDELDMNERLDLYKNFLLYCMTGEEIQTGMGTTVTIERDQAEFAKLQQLGDILGLSQLEVYRVHNDLAETAFRNQCQAAMQGGVMSPERQAQLSELREKMGLSKESADKIIKGVQNQKLVGTLQAAKAAGTLDIRKLQDMQEAGLDVSAFVNEELRLSLYAKEVQRVLAAGTGEFDEEQLLEKLPADLGLDEKKVNRTINEQARERKRDTLVQAVSGLRQKKLDDAARSLNNLLACSRALKEADTSITWGEREELLDLYALYIGKESDEGKQAAIQTLLGVSDKEADSLRELVANGQFKLEQEAAEEAFF